MVKEDFEGKGREVGREKLAGAGYGGRAHSEWQGDPPKQSVSLSTIVVQKVAP